MKITLTFLMFLFVSVTFGKPQVYFNYKLFHVPTKGPMISTSLQFIAGTFKFTSDGSGNLKSSVEITQVFSQEDRIIIADKYQLDSPLMPDSVVVDFYDVQRYALAPGIYTYELNIKDLLTGEVVTGIQTIEIKALEENTLALSDIEFIEDAYKTDTKNNFVRNGYFLLPYLTDYFPPSIDKIAFYYEVYNSDSLLGANQEFLITSSIENYRTNKPVGDIFKFKRTTTATVVPQITFLPIETLPSGEYNLVIRIIDKNNDTVATKTAFFQRRNDVLQAETKSLENIIIDPTFKNSITRDSIPYFLGSLLPISERYEYEIIRKLLKTTDTSYMEKYFYAFWQETSPTNTYTAWLDYKQQVKYTEKLFGTQIKYGWESDRGRVHLQYGAPNAVVDRPSEPSAYPYQIWHYYRIGQRSNVRFVFYNPDLVTNDYALLHSDMQGELQNFRWESVLHKRDSPTTGVDDPGGSVQYGGTSSTLYRGGM